jgi:hypothetical protein
MIPLTKQDIINEIKRFRIISISEGGEEEISSIIEQAPGLTRKYKWYQTTETWVSIYYSDDGGETWQDSGQGWDFS